MMLWIRNITFALILVTLGVLLFLNREMLFTSAATEELTTEEVLADKERAEEKVHEKEDLPEASKKEKNAAAAGLSRFYANLRGTDEDDGPRIKNNIVYLPEPDGDLVDILTAKALVTRPLRSNWRSSKKNAAFRIGFTLNQKLTEYAEESGLELIWWLDKDFLVKDPFRINKDIVRMTYQISKAVEGHFPDGVLAYFCNKHRTLIITEKNYEYLNDECILLEEAVR
ncbi:MAG: TcpQ domain-containing protein [Thalassotalea sp.]